MPISENEKIRIMLADDHPLFIEGLSMMLRREPDFELCGVANNGREVLEMLPTTNPDLILLDINMPKMNGLETIKYIKQSFPSVKIVMLSGYFDDAIIKEAKLKGANGYLLKSSQQDELIQTIKMVNSGSAFSTPHHEEPAPGEFLVNDKFLAQFNLTKREREIIQHIKNGMTNQEMAQNLHLSVYTVETHRKNIMQKLKLNSPGGLMKFIIENQI
ncbi:MAG: response regulator transcription factor [Bacteroidetes bacterium]|nr:response regulator transcription factor [Bacteroidota bacterium]